MTPARYSARLGDYRTAQEAAPAIAVAGGVAVAFLTGVLLFVGAVELGSLPHWGRAGITGLGIFGFVITLLVELASFSVGAIMTNWLHRGFGAPAGTNRIR
jgi:hypothetical protein